MIIRDVLPSPDLLRMKIDCPLELLQNSLLVQHWTFGYPKWGKLCMGIANGQIVARMAGSRPLYPNDVMGGQNCPEPAIGPHEGF
jgi:hypothetical protein